MTYQERKTQLIANIKQADAPLALKKNSSNLFRGRKQTNVHKINVKSFTHVLEIDKEKLIVETEGMITFEDLVDATLEHGMLPMVVPQLKSITLGGAISGGGIESSSFKYGLVHENMEELEVLLPEGRTVICSKKKNKDLFYGFPNSYGTLGYALRIKYRLYKAKKFVKINYEKCEDIDEYFQAIDEHCKSNKWDFVDGAVFHENEMYICLGKMVDEAPYTSDYTHMNIYYKSIQKRKEDYLTIKDYIWRWDTDWFWCSKNLGMQNNLVRALMGKKRLHSKNYWKIMNWNRKWKLNRLFGLLPEKKESVIQDVEIPINNSSKFLKWFLKTVPILPIWVCPTKQQDAKVKWTLYAMKPGTLYINFGFWDTVPLVKPGHYNKMIEAKVKDLDGKKSLYSDSYFTKQEFWSRYNKKGYDKLKKKYDSESKLKDLYEKCVSGN